MRRSGPSWGLFLALALMCAAVTILLSQLAFSQVAKPALTSEQAAMFLRQCEEGRLKRIDDLKRRAIPELTNRLKSSPKANKQTAKTELEAARKDLVDLAARKKVAFPQLQVYAIGLIGQLPMETAAITKVLGPETMIVEAVQSVPVLIGRPDQQIISSRDKSVMFILSGKPTIGFKAGGQVGLAGLWIVSGLETALRPIELTAVEFEDIKAAAGK